MLPNLIDLIREDRVVLFVGAGVSRNLGLPSFSELINHLANELDYDSEIFNTYGDYLTLAEFYKLKTNGMESLRKWMVQAWNEVDIESSEIHRLIVELNFPIIYTTNYDGFLEQAYEHYGRDFSKVVNVGDLAKTEAGITQIVKFHGDYEASGSLVLTESEYFHRLDFESPLDIKFRADLLGKSVLFLGYSLTDINVRYMLYKLNRQWEESGLGEEMPKSFIFLNRPNEAREHVLRNRGVYPIVSELDDVAVGLESFLRTLLEAKAESS